MPARRADDERLPFVRSPRRAVSERGIAVNRLKFQTWHHGRFSDAVNGLSFRARPGRVTSVIGGSAGVRALLLRIVAGTKPYDGGAITIDGTPVAPPSERVSTRGVVDRVRFVGLRADVRELPDPPRPTNILVEEPFAGTTDADDRAAIRARLAALADAGHAVLITDGSAADIDDVEQRFVSLSPRRPPTSPRSLVPGVPPVEGPGRRGRSSSTRSSERSKGRRKGR